MNKIRVILLTSALAVVFLFSCKPETRRPENTVRIRQAAAVKTLNPFLYRASHEAAVFELVYQFLTNFNPLTMQISPQLVREMPLVRDIQEGEFTGGQSFTFEILPEAVWDDGSPVTGYDFAFTLKALFNPTMPTQRFRAYLNNVRDIQVDAENPKKFTVFINDKYFLSEEAIGNFVVLPEHVFDPEGLLKGFELKELTDPEKAASIGADPRLQQFTDAFTSPLFARETVSGSGPYKLIEWVDDQRIVLARKENWWGEKLAAKNPLLAAYPDTIIFLPIPDQTATSAAIKEGSVDMASELDSKQFVELQEAGFVKEEYNFFTPPTYIFFMTSLNNRNPKLNDKRVRRALAHCIDMDAVIRDLYDGLAERQIGPFFPDKAYYDKSLKPIEMNFDSARILLEAAGWTDSNNDGVADRMIDGKRVEMKLQYLYNPNSNYDSDFTTLFKNNAQKAGILIERIPLEPTVMGERLRNGDYEMAGRGARGLPVSDDPTQLWHTSSAQPGGSNYARFGNAASDALIESIASAPDEASRNRLYIEFQRLIYDEQPVIFQLCPSGKTVVSRRFDPVVNRMGTAVAQLKLKP